MSEDRKKIKENKLNFDTYCIFTEGKADIEEAIGLIFRDYVQNLKTKNK